MDFSAPLGFCLGDQARFDQLVAKALHDSAFVVVVGFGARAKLARRGGGV
jgi:hypothetical protein